MTWDGILRRRDLRLVAITATSAMVLSACGARLDPQVRDEMIQGMASRRVVAAAPEATPDVAPEDATSADPAVPVPGQPTASVDHRATSTVVAGRPDAAAPPVQPGVVDTRAMPVGGNGGATDVGVFEDRIVIGNAVDNKGAVPGIFLDAQLATQAYFEYFRFTEGTIHGRRIELRLRDSRLDVGGNREAYLDFCENAFAAVGSMSAFDEGIVDPVQRCGIPDVRAATVNGATMQLPTVFSSDAISIDWYPTNHYLYWDAAYPGVKDRAGILYVDNDTTKQQTRLMRSVAEQVGYTFVVDRAIGLAETNYAQHVIALKDAGATFVEFQGDAPQAVRLAKAMRQQNYWPTVFALQQNLYKPALVQEGGAAIEGAELALGSVMNENMQHHPELQLYRQWLKQIDPSAEPTGQGAYAWGAAALLVDLLKEIGPELTRDKLVTALEGVHDYDGNGLFPPQDIGRRIPTNCHIMAKVEGGRFVPVAPANGLTFECRGENKPNLARS